MLFSFEFSIWNIIDISLLYFYSFEKSAIEKFGEIHIIHRVILSLILCAPQFQQYLCICGFVSIVNSIQYSPHKKKKKRVERRMHEGKWNKNVQINENKISKEKNCKTHKYNNKWKDWRVLAAKSNQFNLWVSQLLCDHRAI